MINMFMNTIISNALIRNNYFIYNGNYDIWQSERGYKKDYKVQYKVADKVLKYLK